MDIVIAFILQQWLHKRASLLRYQYIACLEIFAKFIRFVLGLGLLRPSHVGSHFTNRVCDLRVLCT